MRIAVLIVAIIGSLICFAMAACGTACAGCQGSCGACFGSIADAHDKAIKKSKADAIEKSLDSNESSPDQNSTFGGLTEEERIRRTERQSEELSETSSEMLNIAGGTLIASLGIAIQGLLGIVAGIVAFVKLGKGSKATISGRLLIGGIVLALIAAIVGGLLPGAEEGVVFNLILLAGGGLFHAVAAVLAFIAKPEAMPEQGVPPPVGPVAT